MSKAANGKSELPKVMSQEEQDAALARVVPDIVQAFEDAAAEGQQPVELAPPDPVQMLSDAWERTVELYRQDARLFPDHRGLEPGLGSGTA